MNDACDYPAELVGAMARGICAALFADPGSYWGTDPIEVAVEASWPDRIPAARAALDAIRAAGWVVVPIHCTDVAVGEVMLWTGCDCPNKGWEALNCALNWMAFEEPANAGLLARLGRGEISLAAYRAMLSAAPQSLAQPATASPRPGDAAKPPEPPDAAPTGRDGGVWR